MNWKERYEKKKIECNSGSFFTDEELSIPFNFSSMYEQEYGTTISTPPSRQTISGTMEATMTPELRDELIRMLERMGSNYTPITSTNTTVETFMGVDVATSTTTR